MKRLILMRHAKSDWSFDEPDKKRPLNKRGRRSAEALGDWLRTQRYEADEALVSTAQRTRETWEHLDIGIAVEYDDALYHADAKIMFERLQSARKDTVLMIGHNPGICELAHRLVSEPPSHPRFEDYPTGATLIADFDVEDWDALRYGTGTMVDFMIPRELI